MRMFATALLAACLLSATPQSDVAAALVDHGALTKLSPDAAYHARYLTLAAMPEAMHAPGRLGVSFWVNSLSTKRFVTKPVWLSETLCRLDLRDYGWTVEAWIAHSKRDYYYATHNSLISRAEFFVHDTSDATDSTGYYDFLYGVGKAPKDAGEFRAVWAVDQKQVKRFGLEAGNALVAGDSGVAWENRLFARSPSILGAYWQTYDVSKTNGNVGARNLPNNLAGGFKADASELITNLPNGLQAYFLTNGDEKRVEFAAPDVVKVPWLFTGRRCVDCHGIAGILTPKEFLPQWVRDGVDLYSKKKEAAQFVEAFYLSDPQGQLIAQGTTQYQAAVLKCGHGETVDQIVGGFHAMNAWYTEPVGLEQAAHEINYAAEDIKHVLRLYADLPVQLVGIGAEKPAPRDYWEKEGFQKLLGLLRGTRK